MSDVPMLSVEVDDFHQQVISAVFPDGHNYGDRALRQVFEKMDDSDPAILMSLMEHLQKGTATAHYAVVDVFVTLLDETLRLIVENSGDSGALLDDSYPLCFRMLWVTGNVMEEAGFPREEVYEAAYTPIMLGYGDPDDISAPEWTLRGRAALSATELWVHEGDVATNMDFIEYAGKHSDIGTVIRTAIERSSVNVTTLRSLLESNDVEVSLQRGVL